MSGIVITVTAYEAFGRLQVLITEHRTRDGATAYRLVHNGSIELVESSRDPLADALSQLGVVCWQASERVAGAAF